MDLLDIAIAKQLAGGGGGSGTDNYNDLSNLPKINDVTLSGNKSSSTLGLQSEITSDSKLASDLVDDTNQDNKFVTSAEKTTWNGKQNAIDADHKINADYVDDSTSTNKFVTSTEKNTWNAKQNAIDSDHKLSSDLVDDTNHTNKFVTSTEKQTWNAKQNAIDADHKLSSSLVSFTTAEAAAIASGIDSSKVGQISTNQTNILYALRKVGTNMFNFEAWANKVTVTNSGTKSVSENTITISATTNSDTYTDYSENQYPVDARIPVNAGDKLYMSWDYSSADNVTGNVYIFGNASTGSMANANATDGHLEYTVPASGISYVTMRVGLGTNQSGKSGTWSNIQIIMKSAYDSGVTEFAPYALPNYDLTRLESEDRAGLVECVDGGAKNLATVSSITREGQGSSEANVPITLKAGSYAVSYNYTNSTGSVQLYFTGGGYTHECTSKTGTGYYSEIINVPSDVTTYYRTYVSGGTATVSNIMICTKAAFGVSQKFVAYRPDYDATLYNVDYLKQKIIEFSTFGGGTRSFIIKRTWGTANTRLPIQITYTTQQTTMTPVTLYLDCYMAGATNNTPQISDAGMCLSAGVLNGNPAPLPSVYYKVDTTKQWCYLTLVFGASSFWGAGYIYIGDMNNQLLIDTYTNTDISSDTGAVKVDMYTPTFTKY